MSNRLADCSSVYLRQHADNPIDWYPWGEEAFERARSEGKPVLLSVGYSSCHWCHVMAHECFEDDEVAAVLNQHFVSIKVDREERPDVDDTYMTAVQLSCGRGGWPMTLFLTPDKEPFFAGTYLPKDDRMGQPGFLSVIRGIAAGWEKSRAEFEEAAREFAQAIHEALARPAPYAPGRSPGALLENCLNALAHDFDPHNGGFGGAPKFPPHTAIELLLALSRSQDGSVGADRALAIADATLAAMALGGIRDHVGGGFHRYSTDAHWLLPHFEKMLADNALLLANYGEAHRVIGRPLYRQVANEIIDWLEREMKRSDGLYASALDADSEGEEGRFYVWTWDEVLRLLGGRAVPFMEAYGFARNGNFEDEATGRRTGANVPHMADIQETNYFESELIVLRQAREARPRPGLDDKALIGHNGLLVAGFVAAGRLDLAQALGERLIEACAMGPVLRIAGEPAIGFLDDHAYLAYGLSRLAEADPAGPWAGHASRIAVDISDRFGQQGPGLLTFAGAGHEELFGSSKPFFDQPAPSPMALAARTYSRCGERWLAEALLKGAAGWMERAPTATEGLHLALLEMGSTGIVAGPVRAQVEWLDLSSGEGVVILDIANGWHLYGPEGGELGATRVELSQAADVDYPPGPYTGAVRIPFRVRNSHQGTCEVRITWQPCTDRECQAPGAATFAAQLG